jgi:hypothetical protein
MIVKREGAAAERYLISELDRGACYYLVSAGFLVFARAIIRNQQAAT